MKTTSILAKSILVAVMGFALLSPKAEASATDQVAIQLGALQLGINLSSNSTTDQQRAQALAQGRAVLRSTAARAQVGVTPISSATIQTDALRGQILLATQLALTSPVTSSFTQTVTLSNNRTTSVRATLNPRSTTASAIFDLATKRIPNFSPGLITDAIGAAFSTSAPNTFVFNYRDERSMLADVNKTAGLAMKYALKAYARGTTNWAGVPSGGVGNGTFLPNFSARPIQPRSSSPQAPDLAGLANAAGAVAGAAAAALDAQDFSALTTPGAELTAFTGLATALVKGAASVQRTSTTTGTGLTPLVGGAVAGAGFGQVAMVADAAAADWSAQANASIMNGIIAGGVKGSSANAYAFAWGVATGYAIVWAEQNNPDQMAFDTFSAASRAAIEAQLTANKVKTSGKFDQGAGAQPITLSNLLLNAFNAAFTAYGLQDYSNIAGALGLQLPGTPDPVTDTVGL